MEIQILFFFAREKDGNFRMKSFDLQTSKSKIWENN